MTTPQYQKGNLYQLPIADLRSNPEQPRKVIDPAALEDLKDSISKFGIITPILFRVAPEPTQNSETSAQNLLIIVAGERRYTAAQELGITVVPGICVEGNYAEIALVENIQRQDLTAVEEAEALQRLMTQESYTQEQMGSIVGKARSTLSEILSLNKLPEQIRDECRGDHSISRATLIEIARHKQERGMIASYATYRISQQKQKTSRQAKDRSDPTVILPLINKLTAKLEDLDTTAWSEEEQNAATNALAALRNKINARLNPLAHNLT